MWVSAATRSPFLKWPTLLPHFDYFSGILVPEEEGQLDPGRGVLVPLIDVDVRPADRGRADLHQQRSLSPIVGMGRSVSVAPLTGLSLINAFIVCLLVHAAVSVRIRQPAIHAADLWATRGRPRPSLTLFRESTSRQGAKRAGAGERRDLPRFSGPRPGIGGAVPSPRLKRYCGHASEKTSGVHTEISRLSSKKETAPPAKITATGGAAF